MFKKVISSLVLSTFLCVSVIPAEAQSMFQLHSVFSHPGMAKPYPGSSLLDLSESYQPSLLSGIKIFPKEPFRFDFLMTEGDSALSFPRRRESTGHSDRYDQNMDPRLHGDDNMEAMKLIKYFLASLTVPEGDLWVNLSPHEPDRIIPDALGQTQMGHDLLAQDYMLKKLTASLMRPDGETGKKFWEKIYQSVIASKAKQSTNGLLQTEISEIQNNVHGSPRRLATPRDDGFDQIPEMFNKIWIVPDQVEVYQNKDVAYITNAKLKVMTESDYVTEVKSQDLSFPRRRESTGHNDRHDQNMDPRLHGDDNSQQQATSNSAKEIIKDIILPVIEHEVNHGKHFAPLRQIFHSMILAKWYETHFKNSIIGQKYVDLNKVSSLSSSGLTRGSSLDSRLRGNDNSVQTINQIYQSYLDLFKNGVTDVIREEYDPVSQSLVHRKYFVGGLDFDQKLSVDFGSLTREQLNQTHQTIELDLAAIQPLSQQDQEAQEEDEGFLKIQKEYNDLLEQFKDIKNILNPAKALWGEPIDTGVSLFALIEELELLHGQLREVDLNVMNNELILEIAILIAEEDISNLEQELNLKSGFLANILSLNSSKSEYTTEQYLTYFQNIAEHFDSEKIQKLVFFRRKIHTLQFDVKWSFLKLVRYALDIYELSGDDFVDLMDSYSVKATQTFQYILQLRQNLTDNVMFEIASVVESLSKKRLPVQGRVKADVMQESLDLFQAQASRVIAQMVYSKIYSDYPSLANFVDRSKSNHPGLSSFQSVISNPVYSPLVLNDDQTISFPLALGVAIEVLGLKNEILEKIKPILEQIHQIESQLDRKSQNEEEVFFIFEEQKGGLADGSQKQKVSSRSKKLFDPQTVKPKTKKSALKKEPDNEKPKQNQIIWTPMREVYTLFGQISRHLSSLSSDSLKTSLQKIRQIYQQGFYLYITSFYGKVANWVHLIENHFQYSSSDSDVKNILALELSLGPRLLERSANMLGNHLKNNRLTVSFLRPTYAKIQDYGDYLASGDLLSQYQNGIQGYVDELCGSGCYEKNLGQVDWIDGVQSPLEDVLRQKVEENFGKEKLLELELARYRQIHALLKTGGVFTLTRRIPDKSSSDYPVFTQRFIDAMAKLGFQAEVQERQTIQSVLPKGALNGFGLKAKEKAKINTKVQGHRFAYMVLTKVNDFPESPEVSIEDLQYVFPREQNNESQNKDAEKSEKEKAQVIEDLPDYRMPTRMNIKIDLQVDDVVLSRSKKPLRQLGKFEDNFHQLNFGANQKVWIMPDIFRDFFNALKIEEFDFQRIGSQEKRARLFVLLGVFLESQKDINPVAQFYLEQLFENESLVSKNKKFSEKFEIILRDFEYNNVYFSWTDVKEGSYQFGSLLVKVVLFELNQILSKTLWNKVNARKLKVYKTEWKSFILEQDNLSKDLKKKVSDFRRVFTGEVFQVLEEEEIEMTADLFDDFMKDMIWDEGDSVIQNEFIFFLELQVKWQELFFELAQNKLQKIIDVMVNQEADSEFQPDQKELMEKNMDEIKLKLGYWESVKNDLLYELKPDMLDFEKEVIFILDGYSKVVSPFWEGFMIFLDENSEISQNQMFSEDDWVEIFQRELKKFTQGSSKNDIQKYMVYLTYFKLSSSKFLMQFKRKCLNFLDGKVFSAKNLKEIERFMFQENVMFMKHIFYGLAPQLVGIFEEDIVHQHNRIQTLLQALNESNPTWQDIFSNLNIRQDHKFYALFLFVLFYSDKKSIDSFNQEFKTFFVDVVWDGDADTRLSFWTKIKSLFTSMNEMIKEDEELQAIVLEMFQVQYTKFKQAYLNRLDAFLDDVEEKKFLHGQSGKYQQLKQKIIKMFELTDDFYKELLFKDIDLEAMKRQQETKDLLNVLGVTPEGVSAMVDHLSQDESSDDNAEVGGIDFNDVEISSHGQIESIQIHDGAMLQAPIQALVPQIKAFGAMTLGQFLGVDSNDNPFSEGQSKPKLVNIYNPKLLLAYQA